MVENSWDQFTDFCRLGSEQVQRELREIDLLIQQTASEVDRFVQTNARAVARVRQMESTFDTVPRDDIRKTYDTLIENQQRLFTMRGQLEKLQSDQRNLTRIAELYNKVLGFAPPEVAMDQPGSQDDGKDNTRPMMLDDLGLVPTMRRYVEGIANEGFTGLTLKVTGKDRRLAPHKEITIFRVIQALIHIAREQDQATNIVTHLNIEDDEVRMTMEDNGVGFEIDETLTSPDAVRLNLPTLRERIEMLNGTIRFASAPGKGLRVSLRLPVEVANP